MFTSSMHALLQSKNYPSVTKTNSELVARTVQIHLATCCKEGQEQTGKSSDSLRTSGCGIFSAGFSCR